MAFEIRKDQLDKVLSYLEAHMHSEDTQSISVARKVGQSNYRQIGDPYTPDELAAFATSESALDSILEDKCAGIGSWRLRTYKGTDVNDKVKTQPLCSFETRSGNRSERSSGGQEGAALRDLSVQLRTNASDMAQEMRAAFARAGEAQDRTLDILMEYTGSERAAQDESAGTILSVSLQLVEARMELKFLEAELERVRADAASSVLASLVERTPPAAIEAAILAGVSLLGELGKAVKDRISVPAAPPEQARQIRPVEETPAAPEPIQPAE